MRLLKPFFVASIALLGLRLSASAAPYEERVQEIRLDNGLRALVLEDHRAPVVVFQLWYRVGSRDEVPGRTGLSHLLEHMMFKGTDEVGPEEYSRLIARNGGRSNAFTGRDATTYFATIASDRLDLVARLEADRMTDLRLSAEDFATEREVVKEERRLRVTNDPPSILWERLFATSFLVHPYGQPVIGWMTDLDQLAVEDLRRHYRTYYAPNNAFVVLAGDVSPAQALAVLRRHFGSIAPGAIPPPVRAVEPVQLESRRIVASGHARVPQVAFAFHVPNFHSPDAAALELAAAILGGSRSSRLYRDLVFAQRIATSVAADNAYDSRDASLFTVWAQPAPAVPVERVENALREGLHTLGRRPPDADEMSRARHRLEASFVFAQDSLFYQAMLLGRFEIAGDWRQIDRYLPEIRSVTPEDVARVARVYLDPKYATVGVLLPRESGAAP